MAASLERKLGRLRLPELSRERLIQFGKERAREDAGPVTLAIDLGYIKTIPSRGTSQASLSRVVSRELGAKRASLSVDPASRKSRSRAPYRRSARP
jgi:hypothetical protein